MSFVQIAHTRDELAKARQSMVGTVALVPTMGALHDGHRSLLRLASTAADHVVVSIFVNPLQFGPNEDLDRYPRSLDADLAMCEAEGVSLVFAPAREVVYPTEPIVTVHAGAMGDRLEGAIRRGHFDGVLTVVAKLFGLVRPDVAVFGRKDAQQLALVRRMVEDLALGVRIEAASIVRDADGLALSSRNSYLTPEQRQVALVLPSSLDAAALAADDGTPLARLPDIVRDLVAEADGVTLDYAALVDPDTFDPTTFDPTAFDPASDAKTGVETPGAQALLAAAVRVGNIRLIDNVLVREPQAHRRD